MFVRKADRVLVHGQPHAAAASYWTRRMRAYGTNVVATCGTAAPDVPRFADSRTAMGAVGFDVAVLFTGADTALAAVRDAVEAGGRLVLVASDGVAPRDAREMAAVARGNGVRLLGPGSAGLVVAGECFAGAVPGDRAALFRRGRIGVVARSRGLGALVCRRLVAAGFGQSAFVGVGRGTAVGTTPAEVVRAFAADPGTDAIVLLGEGGDTLEEEAADAVARAGKPVVAFVARDRAPAGRSKANALAFAGAVVCRTAEAVPHALAASLAAHGAPLD
ncbi:succinyl-CoA synthetase subunit alpha [Azospirillum sp. ST 5-10]|uniref:succinyl-CoA synthetase subunit alpha n=1 Tax=unclassified Azospirillum TaxID=2630922 RepID=UPI003F4A01AB